MPFFMEEEAVDDLQDRLSCPVMSNPIFWRIIEWKALQRRHALLFSNPVSATSLAFEIPPPRSRPLAPLSLYIGSHLYLCLGQYEKGRERGHLRLEKFGHKNAGDKNFQIWTEVIWERSPLLFLSFTFHPSPPSIPPYFLSFFNS